MNNLGVKLVTGIIVGVSVGVGITVIRKMIQNKVEVELIEEES